MNGAVHLRPDLSNLVEGAAMTPELVTRLVAVALAQASAVAALLEAPILPALTPRDRAFAQYLARRLARGAILEEGIPDELHAFIGILDEGIEAGTHRYWHDEEHHVRGGYEALYREPEILPLAQARTELASLADMVLAATTGARALRDARALLEN